jgi:hypothetical protein
MRFKALTNGRIAKSDEAEPEWMLVSGDEIDVYFALRDAIHLVEANLDFSNANVSGRRTRPSSAFQWYAGSGLLVIWRGSRHARAITFGFP